MNSLYDLMNWGKLLVFTLALLDYSCFEALRIAWSYSKVQLQSTFGISLSFLGAMDTFYVLVFFLGFCILGSLIHVFTLRQYIIGGLFTIVTGFMLAPFLYGLTGYFSPWLMAVGMSVSFFAMATVWPGIMNLLNQWFKDDPNRGFLVSIVAMGFHFGSFYAAYIYTFLENRGHPFHVCMITIAMIGVAVGIAEVFYLKENPHQAGTEQIKINLVERGPQLAQVQGQEEQVNPLFRKYGIFAALTYPRIPLYLLTYCFVKACIYGFIYWVPTYLANKGPQISTNRGYIAGMTDIGAVVGSLILGALTDRTNKRAQLLYPYLVVGMLALFAVNFLPQNSPLLYFPLLLTCGLSLGGSYSIISTVTTMDLANQIKEKGVTGKISSLIEGVSALFGGATLNIAPLVSIDSLFLVMAGYALGGTITIGYLAVQENSRLKQTNFKKDRQVELQEIHRQET